MITIEDEIWLPIIGQEGKYEISSHGRVKNLCRVSVRKNGTRLTSRERILKPFLNGAGYLCVDLSRKHHRVHRLVAEHFIPRSGDVQVNHINGVKTDNRVNNLEWCSQLENIRHAFKMGLVPRKSITGEKSHNSKNIIVYDSEGNEVERAKGIKEWCYKNNLSYQVAINVLIGRKSNINGLILKYQ